MAVASAAVVALLLSCGGGAPRAAGSKPAPIARIAVLPFENYSSGAPEAGPALTATFLTELNRGETFTVVPPADLEAFLRDERIRRNSELTTSVLARMRERLGADAVVLGVVHEYGFFTQAGEPLPLVGLSVQITDTRTGLSIWGAAHSREGSDSETVFGFGRVHSLSRLAERVVAEVARPLVDFLDRAPVREGAPGVAVAPAPADNFPVPATPAPGEEQERERVRQQARDLWRRLLEHP